MNIRTPVFNPLESLKEVYPLILSSGTGVLKDSNKLEKYNLSIREVFGVCIISNFRNILEPEKTWVFTTEQQISDDGAVAVIRNGNRIAYYENIEQVYLPGQFLIRKENQSVNDYILEHISNIKDKGPEYRKNKTLFVLSDIKSKDSSDAFEWQDFVTRFFIRDTFLHLYFLTLTGHTIGSNEYYLLSFTNQRHRQELNGEFSFKLGNDGIIDFTCIQKINLLDKEK